MDGPIDYNARWNKSEKRQIYDISHIWNLKNGTNELILKKTIIGIIFSDINHTNVFLGQSPKAIEMKTKINKWYLIKLKSFCTANKTINKMKRQLMECEKIFANNVTDKGLISNIYIQLIQLNNRKANQSKNGQTT